MRRIALSHHEIYPPGPLFAWAERHRTQPQRRLAGWHVTRSLDVLPIWRGA